MTDLAMKALRLYHEYEKLPTDRGGKNGPKGKAWQAFVDAKDKALNFNATIDSNPLLTVIIREIIDQFGIDDPINADTEFVDDLSADELDMVELAMWVEDKYVIVISDDELYSLKTVGELEALIRKKANIL